MDIKEKEILMNKVVKYKMDCNCKSIDFEDLDIDIQNDTMALLKLKGRDEPWTFCQVNRNGVYYGFDRTFAEFYVVDNDKLSRYDIKIVE